MTGGFEVLGAGVVLAWAALPLLARSARSSRPSEPSSLHDRLLLALLFAGGLLLVPALGSRLPRSFAHHAPWQIALEVLASTAPPVPSQHPMRAMRFAISPFTIVAASWLVVVAGAALRAAVLGLQLRGIASRSQAAPATLAAQQRRLAHALGMAEPTLLVSHELAAPCAFGVWRPLVIVPSTLLDVLDDAQCELVLRHELTHIKRGDLRSALLVELCSVLFAGHPAARQLVREICLTRELAVDAEVARPDPHAYATLLVQVASLIGSGAKLSRVSMDDTALSRRIAMLTQRHSQQRKLSSRAVVAAAVSAVGLGLAVPQVFASPPFGHVHEAKGDPVSDSMRAEIKACFDAAREDTPNLVINTMMELDARADGTVTSARISTPEAPSFQACVEAEAKGWKVSPPADAPQPPPGADARLHLMFPIRLPQS